MAVPVQHKRSSTPGAVPTTAALAAGQIALNTYDGRAFFKKSVSGTESIVELATTAAVAAAFSSGIISADLNNYWSTSGAYRFNNSESNRPFGWEWSNFLTVRPPVSDTAFQIAVYYANNDVAVRSGSGAPIGSGAWNSWTLLLSTSNIGNYALPISGGTVSGAVSADCFVAWGSSSARGYAAVFAGDASHSGYVSFNAAGGAARGYIGYCDASQLTIATQYDADLAFVRNGVEKFRIGASQSTMGALSLSGTLTLCVDAWNNSADSKNRFYFQTNGSSFYGSQDGHQFQSSSNGMVAFISNDGTMQIAGNSMRITTSSTPVNGGSPTTGNAGEIRWDASYIYVCTSTNAWKRAAISSF